MNFFVAVFFLASLGASSALTFKGGCPEVQVARNFNLTAYFGAWYEYARFYTPSEVGSSCNNAQYSPYKIEGSYDGNMYIVNSQIDTKSGAPKGVEGGIATLDDEASGIAKFTVNYLDSKTTLPYWVLGTDYFNFAVFWSCVESGTHGGDVYSDASLKIITRKKHPSTDVDAAALDVLEANRIDKNVLIYSDQSIC